MPQPPVKERNSPIKLNSSQESFLNLLYSYRFATSTLLAEVRGVKVSATNESLQRLAELGFIGRRYDSSYRLQGKAARYYLALKGLQYLAQDNRYDAKILKAYYRNPKLSENFVDTTIDIMAVALLLERLYPRQYRISNKTEIFDVSHFRLTSPDLYVRRIKPVEYLPTDYLLYVYHSLNFVAVQHRLQSILRDMTDGHWQGSYPTLMFVVPDTAHERRLTSIITKYLQGSRAHPELAVYTSTLQRLNDPKTSTHDLWNPLPPRQS